MLMTHPALNLHRICAQQLAPCILGELDLKTFAKDEAFIKAMRETAPCKMSGMTMALHHVLDHGFDVCFAHQTQLPQKQIICMMNSCAQGTYENTLIVAECIIQRLLSLRMHNVFKHLVCLCLMHPSTTNRISFWIQSPPGTYGH